jgi:hypothetical protein
MTCELRGRLPQLTDRFAYNPAGNGRWSSLNLKKRKKMGGKRRAKNSSAATDAKEKDDEMDVEDGDGAGEDEDVGYSSVTPLTSRTETCRSPPPLPPRCPRMTMTTIRTRLSR